MRGLFLQGIARPGRAALALLLAGLLAAAIVAAQGAAPDRAAAAPVTLIGLEGAVSPGSADHVVRGLARAERRGSQLVVLRLDTPGGLDTSMRQIIKAILASPVPVASYVAPGGARAASAGTYILYASHIAAMAPGTNLGAATPVQIGGGGAPAPRPPADAPTGKPGDAGGSRDAPPSPSASEKKQLNDAVAYIRGLAQLRGRNAQWAEQAVREAVSLPANEALKAGVIDLVASDLDALLKQLDGRTVQAAGLPRTLATAAAPRVTEEPDWRARLLAVLTDPSVALILMMIGVYGLFFEFMNPGVGVPGVLGAICLLIGLYALQMLPVNYAGLALIGLGVAFMAAEAFAPSFGILGIGGVVAFGAGALMLIDTEVPGFGIPLGLVVALALTSALLIGAVTAMALRSRRRAILTGDEALAGHVAEVLDSGAPGLWVRFEGEHWQAASESPLRPGQKVRVLARRGLVLDVAPLDSPPTSDGG
ncbi:NfeD family protein [Caldimonas tepidiphila]|uniref:NfeD family protein n=1 Tax=Caldimonas tepidiphila TaxID=2315841 RepID=UPI000E5A1C78|nr:nodulation protein NfeD [Caldimonas tepidiphila]